MNATKPPRWHDEDMYWRTVWCPKHGSVKWTNWCPCMSTPMPDGWPERHTAELLEADARKREDDPDAQT